MKTDVRGTRLYLPPVDGDARAPYAPRHAPRHAPQRAPRVRTEPDLPVVVHVATTSSLPPDRYRWYRPVTAFAVAVIVAVVAIAALRTNTDNDSSEASSAGASSELAPLTTSDELRETGTRALALVNYPWHDLGYEIVFAPGERDVRAQTDVVAHRITVFLAKGDAVHRVAHDIGHELGHAYDARYLTIADRRAFLNARGKPNARWFPGKKFSDYDIGAGDFAEVFASCHAASPEFRSRLAAKPSQPCNLIPPPPATK